MIEVCSGDYGDHLDKMVSAIDNGRNTSYTKKGEVELEAVPLDGDITYDTTDEVKENIYKFDASTWTQFRILLCRMWLQMWRDKVSLNIEVKRTCVPI